MPDTADLLKKPRHIGRAITVAIVVVAVGVVVWLQARDSTPGPEGSTSVSIRTSGWHPGMAANGAGGPAVVRVGADDCVYIELRGGGGYPMNVIWPAGYAASRAPDGTVTVYNQDGQPVARNGSRIFIGGGSGTGPGCNPDATEIWEMQIDVEPIT
jgi:hypothetical protein